MKDSSDELSTADLAGQSPGSGAADERAARDEGADRTGERPDGFPADRATDAGYAEGSDAHTPDRAYADEGGHDDDGGAYADDGLGGIGSRGPSGSTPADSTVAADRPGYADNADRGGTIDDAAASAGHVDNTALSTGDVNNVDRGGNLDSTAVSAGDEPAMTTDRPGFEAGTVDDRGGWASGAAVGDGRTGYNGDAGMTSQGHGGNGAAKDAEPLLGSAESERFRTRWTDVQTGFVDEPRHAVEQADGLTAELMQHLARSFADERLRLERQWDRGEDIPTDDLRTAFQRYRSFFERLLST